jgi:hypothetical protein
VVAKTCVVASRSLAVGVRPSPSVWYWLLQSMYSSRSDASDVVHADAIGISSNRKAHDLVLRKTHKARALRTPTRE